MAMGKTRTCDRQATMWVATADLPQRAGHPFYERLNRVLDDAGFDTFVEEQCARFYAATVGRPSLAPGRSCRLLLLGYFEGLDSERAIAWRAADSLSIRAFLDVDFHEAPPDHSTLSRTCRLIDLETHEAVFTWVLQRLADAQLVRGHTIGIDATTLEANAAMRSIVRRDSSEAYATWLTRLETLITAAEQVEAVGAAGITEVVGDKGSHSNETMEAFVALGVRSYVSEPDRGRRHWTGKAAARKAVYANRRRIRGARGHRLLRQPGELLERPNAHLYATGGMRRVHLRGHPNILKRLLVHVCGFNLGLLMRQLTGVGTPRSLHGRAAAAFGELIGLLAGCWALLSHSWAPKPRDPSDASCGSPATRQHAHMILNLRIAPSTTGC